MFFLEKHLTLSIAMLSLTIGSAAQGATADENFGSALSYPAPLRPGDAVSVIAPSSAIDEASFHDALRSIRRMGYVPRYRSDILSSHVDFAGAHSRRIEELNEALEDPETAAIWAVRGGYGASYLLGNLDIDKVRAANKWLIGFSDISALHSAWSRAGLASMHGAVGTHVGKWSFDALADMAALLEHGGPQYLSGTPYQGEAPVTGRLVGGNITVLRNLIGTGFLPDWRGAIVLLEDVEELPYRLERDMLHFLQAGQFDGVAGILIGQLTDCGASTIAPDAQTRLVQFFRDHLDVPVLADVPVGHDPSTSRAMVLGGMVTVDPAAGIITLHARQ